MSTVFYIIILIYSSNLAEEFPFTLPITLSTSFSVTGEVKMVFDQDLITCCALFYCM
jgi:hypothetical protein